VQLRLGPGDPLPPLAQITEELLRIAEPLMPFVGDSQTHLQEAWKRGEAILFEGAQATLLDIDHGTYPYVTSSNCSLGGLFAGTGLPPKALGKVLGIAKAYTTRVGAGPMISELHDAVGSRLREVGREFGTTTGRPRRCGWFDAPITAHASRTNGVDGMAIMKLDVLDGLDEVGIVTGYRDGEGRVSSRLPSCAADWQELRAEVRLFPGWKGTTRGVTDPARLPVEAKRFLDALEEAAECPIAYLSTGPDRNEGYIAKGDFLEGLIQA
jgi:adenylosuccinate synthase